MTQKMSAADLGAAEGMNAAQISGQEKLGPSLHQWRRLCVQTTSRTVRKLGVALFAILN